MSNDLRFRATLDDKVSGTLDKMHDKLDLTGKKGLATGIALGAGAKLGYVGFGLLEDAAKAIPDFLDASLKAANENEVAYTKLSAALKANVPGWDGNTEAIKKADEAGAKLGFTDNEMAGSLATLVAATHDVAKAEAIRATAMDLARFKGISLQEATDALTKVEAGSYRILKSLGIELPKNAKQSDALAAVQKLAAGQAFAYSQTTDGLRDALKAQTEAMQEQIGVKLQPFYNSLTKAQLGLLDALNDNAPQKFVGGIDAIFHALSGPFGDVVDQRRKDIGDLGVQMGLVGKHADDIIVPTQGAGKAIDDLGAPLKNATQGIYKASEGLDKWTEQAYLAGIQADKAAPKITDFFDRYSVAVGKGDIAQTKLNLIDDRKAIADIVKEMDKAKPGTAAYKKLQLDLAVAQGKLAADTQALREEQAKLFLLKPSKTGDFKKWTDSLGLDVNNLYGDVKLAYDELQKLLKINVSAPQTLTNSKPPPGTHPKKNAAGGWVGLNGPELSWVGEKGPEYIIPNNQLGKGGMGGTTVIHTHVHLDSHVIAEVVDEHHYYSDARASPSAVRK